MTIVLYRDTLIDKRSVLIEASYTPGVDDGQAPEAESAYLLHVLDESKLEDSARADLRLELAHKFPAEYKRLRRECLSRVKFELDVLAGEHADVRREARQ